MDTMAMATITHICTSQGGSWTPIARRATSKMATAAATAMMRTKRPNREQPITKVASMTHPFSPQPPHQHDGTPRRCPEVLEAEDEPPAPPAIPVHQQVVPELL